MGEQTANSSLPPSLSNLLDYCSRYPIVFAHHWIGRLNAIPSPNSAGIASGKFVARVPKTIHAQLATRAKAEGVSLNTLVLAFIAEGLGRRDHLA
ncbi:toxin-antitoxin system HicB family antitoxin [Herbaspirillum sp. RTI4]|uniref:toxin-antitoxin system HicB family antitoxin n=1 Tax=Herbaspirillum sp. RTI4 TaxID=3048640 RepID=UPI002AB48C72|nr:toxin-antitoxin system HicB family antitoxin [Herbaspirillum sp. RTI4]MDY7576960.1 toxin-antitoxin system HicB family antitoxin [Herbaspirillum sp. RTI4]MEA9982138.1 toxin-antitoxin system HicB family antitoxin [Herbaspirillum sp. RTI4]